MPAFSDPDPEPRNGDPETWVARDSVAEGIEVVRFGGELDVATVDRLGGSLLVAAGDSNAVIVDLSECTFIDSIGISLLLRAARDLGKGRSQRLALVGLRDQVARVLRITGVDAELPVFDEVSEAAEALASK